MAAFLRFLGIVAIIIGVIAMGVIIHESAKSRVSMFGGRTQGELEPGEMLAAFIVLFYHVTLGTVCLALANLLSNEYSSPPKSVQQM